MERRKRNLLVVLIGIVIVVAMVSSFGLGLFAPDTAKIVLPTPEVSQQPGGEPGEQSGLVLVDVTPETVQSVIRDTLSRPDRYTRAVTIEDFWGEGESGTTHADVWVDGGWTQTEAALPGGTVRYSIVGDGQFWLWYGGDRTALSGPADGHSADLEGQRIPTYEDVLELEQDAIAAAGAKRVYLMLGMNCIAGGVDRACQDLVTLVGRIQAKSPDTAILIQSVTPMTADSPRADDALNNTTIQTFNQQMQTLCQEKGWYFVNVAEALSDESGFLRSDFSGDKAMGIHLNYNGAKAWADYLLTHVPQALK